MHLGGIWGCVFMFPDLLVPYNYYGLHEPIRYQKWVYETSHDSHIELMFQEI